MPKIIAIGLSLIFMIAGYGCDSGSGSNPVTDYSKNSDSPLYDLEQSTSVILDVGSNGDLSFAKAGASHVENEIIIQKYDGAIFSIPLYDDKLESLHINNQSQVLYATISSDGNPIGLFINDYETKAETLLSNQFLGMDTAFLNDNGMALFSEFDFVNNEYVVYAFNQYGERSISRISSTDSHSVSVGLNDANDVAWLSSDRTQPYHLFYMNHSSQITRIDEHFVPFSRKRLRTSTALNADGAIAFLAYDTNGCGQVYLRHQNATKQLTTSQDKKRYISINSLNQVVWQGHDGNHTGIYMYADGTISKISANNAAVGRPSLNDLGQVAWASYDDNGRNSDIFLYFDGNVMQLTENELHDSDPHIDNHGNIVYLARNISDNSYFDSIRIIRPSHPITVSFWQQALDYFAELSWTNEAHAAEITDAILNLDSDQFTFLVLGDSRGKNWLWLSLLAEDKINAPFLDYIVDTIVPAFKPDFVMFNGDMMSDFPQTGYLDSFGSLEEQYLGLWKAHFFDPLIEINIPCFPIKGNHELYTPMSFASDGAHYPYQVYYQKKFANFFEANGLNNGPDADYNGLAFHFTVQTPSYKSLFVVMDSFFATADSANGNFLTVPQHGGGPGPWYNGCLTQAQIDWVEDLCNNIADDSTYTHKFGFAHVPLYGTEGEFVLPLNESIWYTMEDYDFEFYFGAHDHLYTRKLITSNEFPRATGKVTQIVTGAGGAGPDALEDQKLHNHPNYSAQQIMQDFRIALELNFVIVTVDRHKTTATAYIVDGDDGGIDPPYTYQQWDQVIINK